MHTKPVPDYDDFDSPSRRGETVHFDRSEHDPQVVREVSRVTWVGVAVNVVLAVAKTAGGILAGSSALLADAAHTVSDLATDAAVLVGVRFWSAPADSDHPHGHHKIETLVTVAIGLALAVVGLAMGYEAVGNLLRAAAREPRPTEGTGQAAWLAFAAAVASIAAKELLYRWTVRKGVELESSAVVANAWHHRSDAFSSIPPALSISGLAVGARFGYDLWFLDPVGTIIVCVMLVQAAWEVMGPCFATLLDASADRQLCSAIRKAVMGTKGVISSHRIRTRIIGSHAVEVDLHITVDKDLSVSQGHAIAAGVKYNILGLRLEDTPRVVEVLVHVEPADPDWEKVRARPGNDTMADWKVKT